MTTRVRRGPLAIVALLASVPLGCDSDGVTPVCSDASANCSIVVTPPDGGVSSDEAAAALDEASTEPVDGGEGDDDAAGDAANDGLAADAGS